MFPVVVLTNRKTEVVREWPFRLAYGLFEQRLAHSDRWLIAGYSFGDAPVNAALRLANEERRRRGRTTPRLLVIGKGGDQAQLRARAARAVGLPLTQVRADTSGLPEATRRPLWRGWAI